MPLRILILSACMVVALTTMISIVQAGSGASPHGMPVAHGQRSATQQVGLLGARFELQRRFSVLLPPGLTMIGRDGMTLKIDRRCPGRLIAPGFAPIGPAVSFDRAIDAGDKSLIVDLKAAGLRSRPKRRFVLAVESRVFCEDAPAGARSLGNGLCSGWQLEEAKRLPKRLRAQLHATRGLRLQFGTVPRGT